MSGIFLFFMTSWRSQCFFSLNHSKSWACNNIIMMLFVSSCAAEYMQRTCSIIAHDFFLGKTPASVRFFIIDSPKKFYFMFRYNWWLSNTFLLIVSFPLLGRIGVLKVINFGIQIVIFSPCNLLTLPSPFL